MSRYSIIKGEQATGDIPCVPSCHHKKECSSKFIRSGSKICRSLLNPDKSLSNTQKRVLEKHGWRIIGDAPAEIIHDKSGSRAEGLGAVIIAKFLKNHADQIEKDSLIM